MCCTLPGSGGSPEVILPVLCRTANICSVSKKGNHMQPKHIYDKNKSLALAWAHKQPNGLRCTIFYAKAGAK